MPRDCKCWRAIGGLLTDDGVLVRPQRQMGTRLLAICQLGWIFNEASSWCHMAPPDGRRPLTARCRPVEGALGGVPGAIMAAYLSDVVPETLRRCRSSTAPSPSGLSPSSATLLADWMNDTCDLQRLD